ncbi:hypothetical protein DB88DRAFT_87753 [Papiliotrema laurentii]|uniref:Uncharacterized protein n=1 Tax=Papiliotrema laurentii TaxID=5418 RepID=A0AAD9CV67_PAPLA|nr:hypothetical protein DB88DRAFT_87753 [Papiliotrema laurentii]
MAPSYSTYSPHPQFQTSQTYLFPSIETHSTDMSTENSDLAAFLESLTCDHAGCKRIPLKRDEGIVVDTWLSQLSLDTPSTDKGTRGFDRATFLRQLSLGVDRVAKLAEEGGNTQEKLRELIPVLFTQGGPDAYEAIVQSVASRKQENPDQAPLIVVAGANHFDEDTFEDTASLVSRLLDQQPDPDASEPDISKVPGLYTVIRGGFATNLPPREPEAQEQAHRMTREAATRVLKELSEEGKAYHANVHTTASLLASHEKLLDKFGAVTMTRAFRPPPPWVQSQLVLGDNAADHKEAFSELLQSMKSKGIPFFVPSLPLMGITATKSDQLPGRKSLASLPIHPDDARRLEDQFSSRMRWAIGVAARGEACLRAQERTATEAHDEMQKRLETALQSVYKNRKRPGPVWT